MLIVLAVAATLAADWQVESRISLTAFANAFDRAQLTRDAAALEEMVSEELIFIDGSGQRRDKKGFIAGWTVPGDSYQPITLSDRIITLLGRDAGIVSAEVTLEGTSDGTRFVSHIRFSDTFKRLNGRWRVVHIQVTRLK